MINARMRHLRLVHSMRPERRPVDPAVRALLEYGRIILPLPQVVRARALARARAALAAQASSPHAPAESRAARGRLRGSGFRS
jgi:hypothetical protein